MPPFIPRKRPKSPTPPPPQRRTTRKKPTLFEAADHAETKNKSVEANRKLIESLDQTSSDSLSDISSDDFEDVLPKKQKIDHDESDEDEVNWENALIADATTPVTPGPAPSGDLELTLSKEQNFGSLTEQHGDKKGPSKIERQIRIATHQMHVQFLLYHYSVRNSWACNPQLQKILVEQLPAIIKEQVKVWRKAAALPEPEDSSNTSPKAKRKAKPAKAGQHQNQRDWGRPAVRQEPGVPNMSRADPLFKLLKDLTIYWKRTFRVTTPTLRKQGYKPMNILQDEVASFHNDSHNAELHGERISGQDDLRKCARKLEGSRDTGALLFTALLRGLGIESRLVSSLQPVGFGWSKAEEASAKKKRVEIQSSDTSSSEDGDEKDDLTPITMASPSTARQRKEPAKPLKPAPKATPSLQKTVATGSSARKQPQRGVKEAPINLDDSSSELSDAQSISSDSVQELKVPTPFRRKPNAAYDRDMAFPNSWVEAISPITKKVIPVDPVVTYTVVSNDEHLVAFEPRGKKADKAKQVLAYIVAYSIDGTAKDVTTRYMKRHMWPGRTKGVRLPVEKIALKDRRGKVRRYSHYDWFKRVMAGYVRPDDQRTAVDDIEDASDLKAVQPESKKKGSDADEQIDTLQGYKQSAHYVLERFLRREEALVPTAEPVRMFTSGKGDATKEEPVFLRSDVVACKTAESWHKEGREITVGQQPLKSVPVRAVTLARKLEVEAAQKETGEKPMQGLYSRDQTEWIVPPPIENGVIPKNAFGNIDCFVPSMVPAGAVHVPYRGTVRACKKLGIDYAEAVTGFEFGNKRAVPVLQGVVIAEENAQMLVDEYVRDQEEKKAREDGKREKAALAMWRKFLMGLRIVERVREEYGDNGHEADEINPFTNPNKAANQKRDAADVDPPGEVSGGFIPENEDDEEHGGGFVI